MKSHRVADTQSTCCHLVEIESFGQQMAQAVEEEGWRWPVEKGVST